MNNQEFNALIDRTRVFVRDSKVGTGDKARTTYLQNLLRVARKILGHIDNKSITKRQEQHLKFICQTYERIRGLNGTYDKGFLDFVLDFIKRYKKLIEEVRENKIKLYPGTMISNANALFFIQMIENDEYFWDRHFYSVRTVLQAAKEKIPTDSFPKLQEEACVLLTKLEYLIARMNVDLIFYEK